jgi:hypothetical protein
MTKLLQFCALAAVTLAAAQTLNAAEAPCPRLDATLHGTYTLHGEGTIVGVGPIASNGTVTYDGKGHTVTTFSASFNGEIQREVTWSGSYTVNPDCTGTKTLNGTNYDFVVMPDGSTLSWIETDPGTVFYGSAVRLKNE